MISRVTQKAILPSPRYPPSHAPLPQLTTKGLHDLSLPLHLVSLKPLFQHVSLIVSIIASHNVIQLFLVVKKKREKKKKMTTIIFNFMDVLL